VSLKPYQNKVVWGSILIAWLCQLIALGPTANVYRPFFLLLVSAYWVVFQPRSVSLSVLWVLGLLTDVITGSLLGEHAFALMIALFAVVLVRRTMAMAPLLQQVLVMGIVFYLYAFSMFLIQVMIHHPMPALGFWFSPILSVLVWWAFAVKANGHMARKNLL